MLDQAGVGFGLSCELRHPAVLEVVGKDFLASLVVGLEDQIFKEMCGWSLLAGGFDRDRGVYAVPHFVGPVLKGGVVGDATLYGDDLVLSGGWRLRCCDGVGGWY